MTLTILSIPGALGGSRFASGKDEDETGLPLPAGAPHTVSLGRVAVAELASS